ncbi:MAG: hypothetical protein O3B41_03370 [Bacteroidetes bacterium]|nr:hypothetical protein [Bacteroidota bacterium]
MKAFHHIARTTMLATISLLTFAGCENTIDPIADEGKDTFAIYGYLDMRSSLQKVRVELLRPTVLSEPLSVDGYQVSSIDQNDGTFQIWKDSMVVLSNGGVGNLFVSKFQPQLGHVYSLIVSRNGVTGAEAIVELPKQPEVFVEPSVGDSLDLSQRIALLGATDKPTAVYLLYEVIPPDDSGVKVIRVAYGDPGAASARGWEFDVNLTSDRYVIMNGLGLNIKTKGVIVRRVSMEMTLFSKEWGSIGKETNLKRAHGFLASVGVFEHTWQLDSVTLGKMGFLNGQIPN